MIAVVLPFGTVYTSRFYTRGLQTAPDAIGTNPSAVPSKFISGITRIRSNGAGNLNITVYRIKKIGTSSNLLARWFIITPHAIKANSSPVTTTLVAWIARICRYDARNIDITVCGIVKVRTHVIAGGCIPTPYSIRTNAPRVAPKTVSQITRICRRIARHSNVTVGRITEAGTNSLTGWGTSAPNTVRANSSVISYQFVGRTASISCCVAYDVN
jgi:hypothetical protein